MNRRQTESKVCSQNLCRGAKEKNKRSAVKRFFVFTLCTLAVALMASACTDSLDIRSDYGFRVEHLPVQERIVQGETAEIRLQLVREGHWDDATYQLRYFQPQGRGSLADEQGRVFAPNDLYDLEAETFRLYYTSASDDQQTIDLYFIDNHGKMFPLSFTFNNENVEEEEPE